MRDFKIIFFKVGNGHCSYIEFPNGGNALVDVKVCSEDDGFDNLINILQKASISTINYLIITHPHRDHIGGLSRLLDNFTIDKFLYSPVKFTPYPVYEDWQDYEDMKKGNYCNEATAVMEDWYSSIGDVRIDYLAPLESLLGHWPDDVNNNSLVLNITARGHKIIIPGDMEEDGWDFIPGSSLKDITVLLAPHHGNKNGYNYDKMKAMNPAFVVISAGSKTEHDADDRYRNIVRKSVYTTRRKSIVARIDSNNTLRIS